MDYVTVSGLRSYMGVQDQEDADDAIFQTAISAASRSIDRAANRTFGQTDTQARYFTPIFNSDTGRYELPIDDVMTTSGFSIDADVSNVGSYITNIASNYRLLPLNAAAKGFPWTAIEFYPSSYVSWFEGSVQVTAKYGWTTVPQSITQATYIQAARFVKRKDAPFGVAGSADMGSELRLLNRLDPDVDLLVGNYKKGWGAR